MRTACPLRGAHRRLHLRASLGRMTELSSSPHGSPGPTGLSPEQRDELDSFSRLREWTQTLLALELCRVDGGDSGESDLLGFRDHPSATLDLTHAHPSGLAMLLAGRRSRLSDLVREPGALADARRRARAVRAASNRLLRLHGVPAGQLAVGMAGWGEDPTRRTLAPVLLRAARLRPRGYGEEDFDLDLAPATRINPVLVEHLRVEYGVPLDAGLLAELAAGQGPGGTSFDPLPMLRRLAETCADVPGFAVEERLVVGVFPEVVPAMVADLEVRGPALVRHPTVRLLAGPLSDTSAAPAGRVATHPWSWTPTPSSRRWSTPWSQAAGRRCAPRPAAGRRRRWPTRSRPGRRWPEQPAPVAAGRRAGRRPPPPGRGRAGRPGPRPRGRPARRCARRPAPAHGGRGGVPGAGPRR